MKTFLFLVFSPDFVKIRTFLERKIVLVEIRVFFDIITFFFFFFVVSTPDFVKFCDEHLFFGLHFRIQRDKVFLPPNIYLCPPPVTLT